MRRLNLDAELENADWLKPSKDAKTKKGVVSKAMNPRVVSVVFIRRLTALEIQFASRLRRFFYESRQAVLERFFMLHKDVFDEELSGFSYILEQAKKKLQKWSQAYYDQAIDIGGERLVSVGLTFAKADPRVLALLQQKTRLIVGIVDTVEDQLREQLIEGHAESETLSDLANRLRSVFNFASGRAMTIARTELANSANQTYDIGEHQSGVESHRWVTAGDEVVRESHAAQDGDIVALGEPFKNGLEYPGAAGGPPEEVINCFLPDTQISGLIIAGLSSKYIGPAREIVTRSGKRLSVTPNHPILTTQGFMPAGQLCHGDNLMTDTREGNRQISEMVQVNQQDTPVSIQEIVQTLAIQGSTTRRRLRRDNLHGDATWIHSEVDIIAFTGSLLDNQQSAPAQHGSESILMKAAVGQMRRTSDSSTALYLKTVLTATTCRPRPMHLSDNEVPALLDRVPLQILSIGAATQYEPIFQELTGQGAAPDSGRIRQVLQRSPALITADEIVEIQDFQFHGHVYDLQSVSGLLLANGIIASNCRCIVVSIL